MPLTGRKTGEGVRVMALVYELLLPSLISIYTHIHMHEHVHTHVRTHTHTHTCMSCPKRRSQGCHLPAVCPVYCGGVTSGTGRI